jgi:signal transduction histidine kinase
MAARQEDTEPRVHARWSLDLSLRTKLTALTGALMVAVTIFVVTYFPNRMDDQGRAWMLRHADGVALILANAVAPGLEFNDRKGVESQLGLLINSPEVSYVVVLSSNGDTFAIWKKDGVPKDLRTVRAPVVEETDKYLHLARPIVAPGGTTGTLALGLSLDHLIAERNANRQAVILVSLGLFVFGFGASFTLGTLVGRPIHQLTQLASEVAGGNLGVGGLAREGKDPPPGGWNDEAKALTAAISAMATQLAEQIEEIDAQRRAAEAERERAVSAEEKALLATKAKSVFLANMSHELRTPLTAIMGYSTILQRELKSGSPQALDDLRRINSSGQHLLELINDVLDLAKIEAGRITLDPRPFDVGGLVDEVTSSVQPLVDRNDNALTVDIAQALPLVELDRTRTGQILLNLLSNAAKFTKNGRIDLRVFPENDVHDDWIVFEVKDSGIGIPPRKLDVIFEAFGQADSSTTREFGGTGLGLTITRQFCEMMRGTIAVSSTVGSGSTFVVRLPTHIPPPEPTDPRPMPRKDP